MPALIAPRILTADDDPIVRADLRQILERAGFEVCPDARDGVEAVREHRPNLILIDLSLPRLSGVEATRRILDERDVPIVALTGHRTGGHIERAVKAGAVGHVLKPFSEAHLIGTLSDVLADRSVSDESAWERKNQLILIESMVRAGRSERDITRAVEGSTADASAEPTVAGRLRLLLQRVRTGFRR